MADRFYAEVTFTTANGPDLDERLDRVADLFWDLEDIDDQSLGATLSIARVDFSATVAAGSPDEADRLLQAIATRVLVEAGEDPARWTVARSG